jgi:hypothetical protein
MVVLAGLLLTTAPWCQHRELPPSPAPAGATGTAVISAPPARASRPQTIAPGELVYEQRGKVISSQGAGIPFAQVLSVNEDGEAEAIECDALGAFGLESASGRMALTVSAPGFIASEQEVTLPREALTIELDHRLVLEGVVVRADTGEPVPDALVAADQTMRPPDEDEMVRTDTAGRFRFPELREGDYTPSARAPKLFGIADRVTLRAGAEHSPVIIRVSPAREARLRILLDGQEPCQDGSAVLSSRVFGAFAALTNNDGLIVFEGLPSSNYALQLSCDAPELRRRGLSLDLVVDDYEGEFVLTRGLSIRGEVVDGLGQPVTGATVFAENRADRARKQDPDTGESDEEGRFLISGLTPGEYDVQLLGSTASSVVHLSASEEARPIVLVDARSTLRGRVVDLDGRAIAHARVKVESPAVSSSSYTDDEGRFEIDSLEPGPGSLEVNLNETDLALLPGTEHVHLPLRDELALVAAAPAGVVTGLVLDDVGPRGNVPVELYSGATGGLETVTDSSGRFYFRHLDCKAGCQIEVETANGETAAASALKPGDDVMLRLRPAARLRGTVVDAPRSFSVSIMGRAWQVFHDSDGAWTLPDLPAGSYVVRVDAEDSYGLAKVRLTAGEIHAVVISLITGAEAEADAAELAAIHSQNAE